MIREWGLDSKVKLTRGTIVINVTASGMAKKTGDLTVDASKACSYGGS